MSPIQWVSGARFLEDKAGENHFHPVPSLLMRLLPIYMSSWFSDYGQGQIYLLPPILTRTKNASEVYSVVLVRKRTIPTERPQPADEVSANFS
jgi:hypothetical protein